MAAEYDLVRKPNEKGDGTLQPLYPRIVSKGTIDTRELIERIVKCSTFSYGDVEGVFAELTEKISDYLIDGYHVEFGKMGYFSAKLAARPVMDKKEIRAASVHFENINFRPSSWFRKYSRGSVERATHGFNQSTELPEEERRRRLEVYLDKHPFITRTTYSSITGLLKNRALKDLNKLIEDGVLSYEGSGCHKVYVRAALKNE